MRAQAGAALALALAAGCSPREETALRSPCESTRIYALGTIDERFLATEFELRSELEDASAIWNATQRKPLLSYDASAKLKIDFDYDERQALTAELGTFKTQLDERKRAMAPGVEQLEKEIPLFNEKQKSLNAKIDAWNAKGGAPPEEAARLKTEREQLDQEYQKLKRLESTVKSDAGAMIEQAKVYNETVGSYNQAVSSKPEQGVYDSGSDRITIHFGGTREELVHTMAHELGHALGLFHTEDPGGIMFPRTNSSLHLSSDDRKALAELCGRRVPFPPP